MEIPTDPALAAAASQATTTRTPTQTLGQDEFLRLLTVQMANQDPLEPMSDTEFIAQMANFTSLEQTKELTDKTDYQTATGYLGKEADINARDPETGNPRIITGTITAVNSTHEGTRVVVDGIAYDAADVISLRHAPANAVDDEKTQP